MATQISGGQSPKSFSRTVEKSFEDAKYSGVLNLNNRKLKDFPKVSKKYDLSDTTQIDLSDNRLIEIPVEACKLDNLEHLNCYGNVLKCIPQAIVQLQSLVHLNLSRNQLSFIPDFIGQLKQLQVLLASNNRLVSMPEEISQLHSLMDLDISCNEITHLPEQMGEMEGLKSLNVRSNLLVELPTELYQLKLQHLDVSDNRISTIPNEYGQLTNTLEDIRLQNNPLVSPPAKVCSKGRVHIMKYLEKEAVKEDRKRGVLSDHDIKSKIRTGPFAKSLSDEFQNLDAMSKRRTVDSGYSTTTDSSERSSSRFSPDEGMDSLPSNAQSSVQDMSLDTGSTTTIHQQRRSSMELQKQKTEYEERKRRAEAMKLELERKPSITTTATTVNHNGNGVAASDSAREETRRAAIKLQEEQKAKMREQREHLNNNKPAVNLHIQADSGLVNNMGNGHTSSANTYRKVQHSGSFKEENTRENNSSSHRFYRRTISESQHSSGGDRSSYSSSDVQFDDREMGDDQLTPTTPTPDGIDYRHVIPQNHNVHDIPVEHYTSSQLYHSPQHNQSYVSPSQQRESPHYVSPSQQQDPAYVSPSQQQDPAYVSPQQRESAYISPTQQQQQRDMSYISPSQDKPTEFRRRREALISQQRHEAQLVRRRIEEEKSKLKQRQKDAVLNYVTQRGGPEHNNSSDDGSTFSFSRDSTPNTSFDANTPYQNNNLAQNHDTTAFNPNVESVGTPPNYQRALDKLEAMSSELNNTNPGFTLRRQLDQYVSNEDQIEELRMIIEGRLKVKLPDDLPSALRDGVVLCHLANHIRPRSISSIHVPSQAVPKLSMAKCRRNVENFLEACRQIGVREEYLCPCAAILEANGIPYLSVTIQCLVSQAAKFKPQQSTV